MEINGYPVKDLKLAIDGTGNLLDAPRTCDICLRGTPKVVTAVVHDGKGGTKSIRTQICTRCMIKEGYFLDMDDLRGEIRNMAQGRGRG